MFVSSCVCARGFANALKTSCTVYVRNIEIMHSHYVASARAVNDIAKALQQAPGAEEP
jgi:hypothetical protein